MRIRVYSNPTVNLKHVCWEEITNDKKVLHSFIVLTNQFVPFAILLFVIMKT